MPRTRKKYEYVESVEKSEKIAEQWLDTKWRPMMGWTYMLICIFDFLLAPIFWSIIQATQHGQVNVEWQPLTLQGAGLFHLAMGAILGIAAFGRTQEKINAVTGSVGSTQFNQIQERISIQPSDSVNAVNTNTGPGRGPQQS
jgi:Holin of 3TMs, for gene-transfer release